METILTRAGVVGLELPRLQASVTTVAPGDVVILATDGISRTFLSGLRPLDTPQLLAERILRRHAKGTDDALVLAARYRAIQNPRILAERADLAVLCQVGLAARKI